MAKSSTFLPKLAIFKTIGVLFGLLLLNLCNASEVLSLNLSSPTLDMVTSGSIFKGEFDHNQFGSSAGDIDSDGFEDFIVRVPGTNNSQGAVYVIYDGESSSLGKSLGSLDLATTGFTIKGNPNEMFGGSTGIIEDMNDDGYGEMIIQTEAGSLIVTHEKEGNQGTNSRLLSGNPKSNNCPINCTRCSNPFSCIECTDPYLLYESQCVESCPDDTFPSAGKCEAQLSPNFRMLGCTPSLPYCIECSGNTCFQCTSGFLLKMATMDCWSSCGAGMWPDTANGICSGCRDGCTQCTSDKVCTSCQSGYTLQTNYDYTLCYINCPTGCSACSSTTTCTACESGYFLSGTQCGTTCPVKTYPNTGTHKCTACITGCDTCITSSACTACSTGYYLLGGGSQCTQNCPAGAFVQGNACELCSTGCTQCTDASSCSQCASGYLLTGSQCAACPTGCSVCSTTSTCNTCSSGYYLYANLCTQNCPSGTLDQNGICEACPDYCDVCSSPSTCTKCFTTYFVSSGQCEACLSNCDKCSSSSVCDICSSGFFLYSGQCDSTCPATFFGLNGVCQNCLTGCTECTTASTCDVCSSGFYLSASNGCPTCPTECSECMSLTICTACSSGFFLFADQCGSACPSNRFADSGICQVCSNDCDVCVGLATCGTCSSGFFLSEGQCVATCSDRKFPSTSTGACEDCPLHCSSCTSKTSCQSCDEGYSISGSLCIVTPSMSASTVQAQQKATKAVSSAVTGAGSVLCVGSPTFPLTALVSQIVQNTRYLNITVTTELAEIYQTWNTDMISWDPPNTFSKLDDFETSPFLFSQYGLGSSFMTNFWPTFMTIMVGLSVLSVSFMLRILLEKGEYRGRLFSVAQRLFAGSFNFVIVQVYGCLDDILFNLVLDTKTNPFDTFFCWMSLFFAVGFLVIGCGLVFMNMRVVYKYQAIKTEGLAKNDTRGIEAFNERNKYWELFYSEFNDEDFWSQSALALLIIRSTLSSLTITVFYDYPMMQTSFLVMLDGVTLLFLFFKKPFITLRGTLAQYYFETITALVHICTFILALQDTFPGRSEILMDVLCTGIMYLIIPLQFGFPHLGLCNYMQNYISYRLGIK